MDYFLMVSFILLLREHKAEVIRLMNTIHCRNLDEAFRRIYKGAVVIRTNGEVVEGFGVLEVVDLNDPNFKRKVFGGGRICQINF
ncbi:reverse transcriptase domain-containing protein, partial [Tanacetum coccineum]